ASSSRVSSRSVPRGPSTTSPQRVATSARSSVPCASGGASTRVDHSQHLMGPTTGFLSLLSASSTSVWTGRALQAGSDDLEIIGLALLYPALEWSVRAPGHHGYPRASVLIRV